MAKTPLTQWAAVARPLKPGESGTRYFVTNQEGVIYFTTAGPFQVNAACEIPAGAAPVGE